MTDARPYPWYQRTVEAKSTVGEPTCTVTLRVKPALDEDTLDRWVRNHREDERARQVSSIATDDPSPSEVELCQQLGIGVEWWVDAVREGVGRWSERGPFASEETAKRNLDDWAAEPPVYNAERADPPPDDT